MGLASFSLGAIFSAAAIEGSMHILVHYFQPIANFMTHVAAFVMPGLDLAWAFIFPMLEFVGISDLFTQAAGAMTNLNLSPVGVDVPTLDF